MSAHLPQHSIPVTEADLRTLICLNSLLPVVFPADEDAQVMIGRIQTQRPDNPTALFEAAVVGRQWQGENRNRVMYKGIARGLTREDAVQRLIAQIEVDLDKSWKDFPNFDRTVQHRGSGGSDDGSGGEGSEEGGAPTGGKKKRNNCDADDRTVSKKKAKMEDWTEGRDDNTAADECGQVPGNETKHAIPKAKRRREIPTMSIAAGVYTS